MHLNVSNSLSSVICERHSPSDVISLLLFGYDVCVVLFQFQKHWHSHLFISALSCVCFQCADPKGTIVDHQESFNSPLSAMKYIQVNQFGHRVFVNYDRNLSFTLSCANVPLITEITLCSEERMVLSVDLGVN